MGMPPGVDAVTAGHHAGVAHELANVLAGPVLVRHDATDRHVRSHKDIADEVAGSFPAQLGCLGDRLALEMPLLRPGNEAETDALERHARLGEPCPELLAHASVPQSGQRRLDA